jgi:hypothetical protein
MLENKANSYNFIKKINNNFNKISIFNAFISLNNQISNEK